MAEAKKVIIIEDDHIETQPTQPMDDVEINSNQEDNVFHKKYVNFLNNENRKAIKGYEKSLETRIKKCRLAQLVKKYKGPSYRTIRRAINVFDADYMLMFIYKELKKQKHNNDIKT